MTGGWVSSLRRTLLRGEVVLHLPGLAGATDDPRFIGKVRGALGERLLETASPAARRGDPCPWSPPCAFHALWRPEALPSGLPAPAPYVLETDADGEDLFLTLRLFGRAADYLGEASDALLRGLATGITGYGPLQAAGRDMALVEGCPELDALHTHAELHFITPLLLRNGDDAHIDPWSLLISLARRAAGISTYTGLPEYPDVAVIADRLSGLRAEWSEIDTTRWKRRSQRQGQEIPMEGAKGTLRLQGPALSGLADLISLGSIVHAGSRTAWGLGRYRIGETG